ncbi:MAG: 30S ribosomal protein S5 [Candidatus Zambryskibacteria bacterium]|nr:30S ribosomal protein S5 [Candidatus Zambryskibacteria bacterium]
MEEKEIKKEDRKEVEKTDKKTKINNNFKNENKTKFRQKNERRPSRRPARVKQEFDNKIIDIRRVTRVVAGGRRFSFSIVVVIGDRKGRVGVGIGKAGDTPIAIEKAIRDAKKHIIKVSLTDKGSIAHPVNTKYASAEIFLNPAPGKGVIAGSAVRVVLELAGIKEVSSKILSRSKNKLNIARAAVKALLQLKEKNKEKVKINS